MRLFSILLFLGLAACSPQPAAEATPTAERQVQIHPVSGLEVIPLTVISGTKRHQFRVEAARSDAAQARGYMFRTEIGPDEGMIFPRNPPDLASFWMKNTPLPLDIIFVGVDGRINNIAAETVPYSLESVTSVGLAGAVLELRGGRAEELGIATGDRVEW